MSDFDTAKSAFESATKQNAIYKDLLIELECCPKNKHKQCDNDKTSHHEYIHEVRFCLRGQEEVTKNLLIIPILLNSYPHNLIWDANFNRPEYIRYHLENWFMNVVRLHDINLQLINVFYDFGINAKDVNERLILNHSHLEEKIKNMIKLFKKAINDVQSRRNLISHRHGFYYDDELEYLIEVTSENAFWKFAKQEGLVDEHEQFFQYIDFLDVGGNQFLNKDYANKKRKEMHENNLSIFKFVGVFNDEMRNVFKGNLPALEK
jgi:hypothetical protein